MSFDGDAALWDFEKVMRRALSVTLAEPRRRVPGQSTSRLMVDEMVNIRNSVWLSRDANENDTGIAANHEGRLLTGATETAKRRR